MWKILLKFCKICWCLKKKEINNKYLVGSNFNLLEKIVSEKDLAYKMSLFQNISTVYCYQINIFKKCKFLLVENSLVLLLDLVD